MNRTIVQRDKLLFAPGTATTSLTVKAAMLRDVDGHDPDFHEIVTAVRRQILQLVGQPDDRLYTTLLLPGGETVALEAVLRSTLPRGGKLLTIINGAGGERIVRIAGKLSLPTVQLRFPEDRRPDLSIIADALARDPSIHTVAAVHCETGSGLESPLQAIGDIVSRYSRLFMVDASSSLGALPIDQTGMKIHYLVASPTQCLESVAGLALVVAHRKALERTEGLSRSFNLDLLAHAYVADRDGRTPYALPVQAVLALHQALHELDAEGGVAKRAQRYQANAAILTTAMTDLGFRAVLAHEHQTCVVTAFRCPDHAKFDYPVFVRALHQRGFIIDPGRTPRPACFSISTIGQLTPTDMTNLVTAIRAVLLEMDVPLPLN